MRDKARRGWSHDERRRSTSHVPGEDNDDTITPPSRCAALDRVEPELFGLPGKALARDITRSVRFDLHAVGWLHSMVFH